MLKTLGYRVSGYDDFRQFAQNFDVTLAELEAHALKVAATTDATKDSPWPLFYPALDAAFPGSKFILILRNEKAWINSAVNDFGCHPNAIRQVIYGTPYPEGNEETWLQRYRKHNEDVQAYFAERPEDLLVQQLEDELSFEQICHFLNKPVVDLETPVANTRFQKKSKTLWRRIKKKF